MNSLHFEKALCSCFCEDCFWASLRTRWRPTSTPFLAFFNNSTLTALARNVLPATRFYLHPILIISCRTSKLIYWLFQGQISRGSKLSQARWRSSVCAALGQSDAAHWRVGWRFAASHWILCCRASSKYLVLIELYAPVFSTIETLIKVKFTSHIKKKRKKSSW